MLTAIAELGCQPGHPVETAAKRPAHCTGEVQGLSSGTELAQPGRKRSTWMNISMAREDTSDREPLDEPHSVLNENEGVRDVQAGPSDSSDSGSDAARPAGSNKLVNQARGISQDVDDAEAEAPLDFADPPSHLSGENGGATDTDAAGTGERSSADQFPGDAVNQDIGFDRVVSSREAGLGDGLDQAEEAILGITDEELFENSDDWP